MRHRLIVLAALATMVACGDGAPGVSPAPTEAPTTPTGPTATGAPSATTEPSESEPAPTDPPTGAAGAVTVDFSDPTGWGSVDDDAIAIAVEDGELHFDLRQDTGGFVGIPGLPAVITGSTSIEVDVERTDDGDVLSSAGVQCWVRSAQLNYFFYAQVAHDGRYTIGRFTEAGRDDLVVGNEPAASFEPGARNRIGLDCIEQEDGATLALTINGEEAAHADIPAGDADGAELWTHGNARFFTQGGPASWTYDDLTVTATPRASLDGQSATISCPEGDTTDDKGNPIAPPYPGSDIVSAALSVEGDQLSLVIKTTDDIQQDFTDAEQRFAYGAEISWGNAQRLSYESRLTPSSSEDGEPGWHDQWHSRLDDLTVEGAPTVAGDTFTSVLDMSTVAITVPFTWSVYVQDRANQGDRCPAIGGPEATFPG